MKSRAPWRISVAAKRRPKSLNPLFSRLFSIREVKTGRGYGENVKSNLSNESAEVVRRETTRKLLFQFLIRQSVRQEKFARRKELI